LVVSHFQPTGFNRSGGVIKAYLNARPVAEGKLAFPSVVSAAGSAAVSARGPERSAQNDTLQFNSIGFSVSRAAAVPPVSNAPPVRAVSAVLKQRGRC
jgi:hypothetical protein